MSTDRERQLLEGEMMKPRNKADVTGLVAVQLAFARWIGAILERRKKSRNG